MVKKFIIHAGLACGLFLSGCSPFQGIGLEEYKETRSFFGAYVTIQCFYDKRSGIHDTTERCWRRLGEIQASMNARSDSGYVARINGSGPRGVQVSDDVYDLLKEAVVFSEMTDGAFDVTVLPLVELWKEAAERGVLPDKDSIEAVLGRVDYKNILLEGKNTVILKKIGMKIDLGAIAKGYAVDEASGILRGSGVKHFMIDAGGDIYCEGLYRGRELWKIGVQDPGSKERLIDVLKLSGKAVTTSGDYERFYTVKGRRFSHIIDPRSGYPQEGVISATVIAPTACEADALSTALCVIGGAEGVILIDSLHNAEAMIVENRGGETITYLSTGYR